MQKLKCIAVDDEPLALELLEDNIRQIPFLELVAACPNAFEAIDVLQEENVDLLFLDIQMPGITGLEFLKSLQSPKPPMVIFITAYEQFALEGFELNVVDYLLKPVAFERFLKAANKANEYQKLRNAAAGAIETQTHFFVNANYALVKIKFDEIMYIEGLKDYVKIYLTSAKHPIITRMTLKSVELKLPTKLFMRVHKSFIISSDKILSVRNLKIHIGDTNIPVGEQYAEEFMKMISEN